eukprot:TRINITY_DN6621_c0_g1_i3.p1 TRINITY_DN6621_c0_g1~~TRINITY_DN6621_c0_g1_i3.p1  ORF type:complete len:327 (+),score=62.33 TRINITY_DN6621_c0_g1_i3:3-983(+)
MNGYSGDTAMADCSQLLNTGLGLLHQACELDRANNYREAIRIYSLALEAFLSVLKMEKNERIKAQLKDKVFEYMNRAEQLKGIVAAQERGHAPAAVAAPDASPSVAFPSVPTARLASTKPVASPVPVHSTPTSISSPTPAPPAHSSPALPAIPQATPSLPVSSPVLHSQSIRIQAGQMGCSYATLFGPYLTGARSVLIEDPYIRSKHQIANFVRLCELIVKMCSARGSVHIHLVTSHDTQEQKESMDSAFLALTNSLRPYDVGLSVEMRGTLHDRDIRTDTGWSIKIGRGLDIYQKSVSHFAVGSTDMDLRPCLETSVDIFKVSPI